MAVPFIPLPPEFFPEPFQFKHFIFIGMTVAALAWLIPNAMKKPWMDKALMAAFIYSMINPIGITLFSYTAYRGDIRGIEFTTVDWLIITFVFMMTKAQRWKKYKHTFKSPNYILMVLYFLACAATLFTAMVPQFVFFGLLKLIKSYMIFWVAYNYIRDEEKLKVIINTFGVLSIFTFLLVLQDKYLLAINRPTGPFPHQNDLATYQNQVNMILLAVLLGYNDKVFGKMNYFYWASLGCGTVTVFATLSRAGMAMMFIGYFLVIILSLFLKQKRNKSKKKKNVIGLMLLCAMPIVAIVLPQVIKRFETAPKSSAQSRHGLNIACKWMGDKYILGAGFNNFSFAINNLAIADELNIAPQGRGLAHHIYWLHYAEVGLIGAAFFIMMLSANAIILLIFIAKRKDTLATNLAIGILGSLFINAMIGTLEWAMRSSHLNSTYFFLAGLACGLSRADKEIKKDKRKEKMLQAYYLNLLLNKNKK